MSWHGGFRLLGCKACVNRHTAWSLSREAAARKRHVRAVIANARHKINMAVAEEGAAVGKW
ncbi:hypothetical protein ACI01nite_08090 [Acetobacter cibinongensis]|uniref:Uncharacterized protein n=1 Tax=Acetobacter cibinongensis TaxID=146475 RepID=A0A0D6N4K7_9PROT|nr:hypothetical protein Abci_011_233 [Acetobacter cibinongensis]GBQ18348.1 hypothetical protein AA0482_2210 [Acetobacter cibinongensis NRIC 0482]GEL58207.1 hypothetical protein ACI01nite_08090 [Acetobacter cibinongensis]